MDTVRTKITIKCVKDYIRSRNSKPTGGRSILNVYQHLVTENNSNVYFSSVGGGRLKQKRRKSSSISPAASLLQEKQIHSYRIICTLLMQLITHIVTL